jgi:hypothetical protein
LPEHTRGAALFADIAGLTPLIEAYDPRAPAVLEATYERRRLQATKILDAALQRSFLENVPYHREIVAAWAEKRIVE